MATVAIIQARLGSRRFPGKALADLEGHPLIWHTCTRVLAVPGLASVNLVCPESDADAFRAVVPPGVEVYPFQTHPVRWHPDGSVAAWDVLGAYTALADALALADEDWILRVTGDCPCWAPEVGTLVLKAAQPVNCIDLSRWLFSADTTCSGWPDGFDAEAFSAVMLRTAHAYAEWPLDREHVTRWMRRSRRAWVVENPHGDWGHLKLSVDTPEDLTAVREYLQRQPVDSLTTKRG